MSERQIFHSASLYQTYLHEVAIWRIFMTNIRVRKRAVRKRIKRLIVLILVVSILLVSWFGFQIRNITIVGESKYTEDEIIDFVINDRLDHHSLYLYFRYKYFDKEPIPFIQDINIKLVDKNSVKIYVYEKIVTGCIEFMGEYMYFDKDGTIVETSKEKEPGVPLVQGLNYSRIVLYKKLEVEKEELFTTILNITKLIDYYGVDINVIKFNADSEVTLISDNHKVLLGKKDYYDEAISQLPSLFEKSQEMSLTFDMRNYTVGAEIIATPNK